MAASILLLGIPLFFWFGQWVVCCCKWTLPESIASRPPLVRDKLVSKPFFFIPAEPRKKKSLVGWGWEKKGDYNNYNRDSNKPFIRILSTNQGSMGKQEGFLRGSALVAPLSRARSVKVGSCSRHDAWRRRTWKTLQRLGRQKANMKKCDMAKSFCFLCFLSFFRIMLEGTDNLGWCILSQRSRLSWFD